MCPIWPHREHLTGAGLKLFDSLVDGVVDYVSSYINGNFASCLVKFFKWSGMVGKFIDETRIDGNEEAKRLIKVYLYYANVLGIDWSKIQQVSR